MKSWLIPLIAVLTWSSPAWAVGTDPSPGPSPSPAASPASGRDPVLTELLARSPRNRGYADGRKPDRPILSLTGDLGHGGDPVAVCHEFLRKYGKLLGCPEGFDPAHDVELIRTSPTDAGQTLSFAPTLGGCPYLKSTITMMVAATGTLTGVSGRYHRLGDVDMGGIDATRAARLALAAVAGKGYGSTITSDGTLSEFLDDEPDGRVHHHYLVNLVVGYPPRQRQVLLGAGGNVISEQDGRQSEENAIVITGYPGYAKKEKKALKDLIYPGFWSDWKINGHHFKAEPFSVKERAEAFFGHFDDDPFAADSKYGGHACQIKNDDGTYRTCSVCTSAGVFTNHDCHVGNPPFLETNIYHHLCIARDKALSWGAMEITTKYMKFDHFYPHKVRVRRGDTTTIEVSENNAYFYNGDWSLTFYSINPDSDFYVPAMDQSVIYHEFGHSIHRALHPEYPEGGTPAEAAEAKAVSEGFGDFFACTILDNPDYSATWDATATNRRNCKNTKTYADVTPCYRTVDGNHVPPDGKVEIHDAGVFFSGLCWDLREKLGAEEAIKLVIAGLRLAPAPHSFNNAAVGLTWAYQDYLFKNPGATDRSEALTTIFFNRGINLVVIAP